MPKLLYFPVIGRAQATRFLLAVKGVEFEDVRLSMEEWGAMKAAGTYGTAQLPILVADDGTYQSQSMATLKALAFEHGYGPTSAKAMYESEWYYAMIKDVMETPAGYAIMQDDPTEEAILSCIGVLETVMDRLETHWNDGRTSVSGEGITGADFALMAGLCSSYENPNGKHARIRDAAAAKLAASPNVLRVCAGVRALCAPHIAAMPASPI